MLFPRLFHNLSHKQAGRARTTCISDERVLYLGFLSYIWKSVNMFFHVFLGTYIIRQKD